MTDTFLDDHDEKILKGDLNIIAASSADLLRIARREVSPPGGRAHRNPNGYESRPPLNTSALSVSEEMRSCLTEWAVNLRDDLHIRLPHMCDDKGLAIHLRHHAHRIAQRPWADDCAREIAHWARIIQTMTTPPPPKLLADYTPEQRREGMTNAKVDAPTCAELVAEWTKGDCTPTADQIRNWGKRNHVTRFGPQPGKGVYSPREVIAHMRRKAAKSS